MNQTTPWRADKAKQERPWDEMALELQKHREVDAHSLSFLYHLHRTSMERVDIDKGFNVQEVNHIPASGFDSVEAGVMLLIRARLACRSGPWDLWLVHERKRNES